MQEINSRELVSYAVEHGVPSISFTYNEPTVFMSSSAGLRISRCLLGYAR